MKRLSILLACLLLTACQTPEQIAAAKQQQMLADAATCSEYGFKEHTDAFRNCMLQIAIAREQMRYYNPYPYHPHTGIHYYH